MKEGREREKKKLSLSIKKIQDASKREKKKKKGGDPDGTVGWVDYLTKKM